MVWLFFRRTKCDWECYISKDSDKNIVRAVEIPDTPDHPSLDHSDSPAQLYASLKECTYATEAREKKTSVVYFSNKAHTQKKKKIKLKKNCYHIISQQLLSTVFEHEKLWCKRYPVVPRPVLFAPKRGCRHIYTNHCRWQRQWRESRYPFGDLLVRGFGGAAAGWKLTLTLKFQGCSLSE